MMSSVFHPDDSLFEPDESGEVKGVGRIKAALRKHGVRIGNGVITSRDPGMQAAQKELKREVTLPGIEQWLLPIIICPKADQPILWLMSHMKAGAKVPPHSHVNGHVRVVVQGSCRFGTVELQQGDWMLVPAEVPYDLEAGAHGCIWMYPHPTPPCLEL